MITSAQAYTPGKPLKNTTAMLVAMKEKGTLQSYVAQHKNSPEYPMLLSLAATINQVSDATKAAQHQQPQQTVADQQLAALAPAPAPAPQLPENVGIGQLPAPNMQTVHKAAGGIIAFDEGGEVPRFADTGLVQLPGGAGIYSQGAFGPQAGSMENLSWAQRKMDEIASKVDAGTATTQEKMWLSMFGGAAKERLSARQQQALYQNAPNQIGGETSRLLAANAAAPQPTTNQVAPPSPTPDGASGAGTGGAGGAGQPAAGLPSIDAYMKRFEMGLPKKEEAQSEETFMSKREAPMKEYFAKANQAIEKERSRLEEGKQQDFYRSLIEGGLAAAGGSSQYGLQNIAQGFSKGAASFREALKDFRRASQENSKMEMDLMKAKAADKKGDMDAYQKHMDSVAERNSKVDGYKVAGLSSLLGHKISADATITAAGVSAAASRELANSYRAPALAEQIRQHISKELDSDPRYKYDAVAKAAELERRVATELKKYPSVAQYASAPGGGGAVDTTGFKVLGSRPSQ
jgi:hypothetical protein